MRLSLLKIALALVIILTTTAGAQEQGLVFSFFGGGARSEGMGQAFLGISNDGTAASWNPAGLYVHERTLMSFSYDYLLPRGEYTFQATPIESRTYDHTGSIGTLNYWSIISPLRVKNHHFVLNLSYTKNFDTYFQFAERLFDWEDDPMPNATLEKYGHVSSVNLALGTRIYEKLSFGLSANIYLGNVVSDERRILRMDTSYAFGDVSYVSRLQLLDSTSFSGFSTTLGFLYDAGWMRGGLVVRAPFNLKSETDSSIYRLTSLNEVMIDELTDTVYIDNLTSQMEMPIMVGVGAAFNASEELILAVDLEYRAFKDHVVKNLDSLLLTAGGDRREFYTDRNPNWSNVWQYRLGAEYTFKTPIGMVPVRCGFRNEQLPGGNITGYSIRYEGEKGSQTNDSSRISYIFDNENTGLERFHRVTGYSLAFGGGIHWSQIMLDFAYTYTAYEQEIYRDPDADPRSFNRWKNHHLNFTFTGYF